MRTLGIVVLVLLVLLLALPMGVGMAVSPCPDPHLPSCMASVGVCLAILGLLALFMPALAVVVRSAQTRPPLLLVAATPEKPPRFS